MRKILLLLSILFCFAASAQYQNINRPLQYVNTFGYQYERFHAMYLMGLPADTFAVPALLQNIPFIANKAGSIYLWNISTHVWDLFSSGGGDFWSLTGNAIAQDTSKFIGTTDSSEIALRFRVNNYNAGFIGYSYQTPPANAPYTNDGNNHTGIVALGYRAADSLRKIIDAGGSVGGGSTVAIGSDALRDNSVAQNTAIGSNAMKRARTMSRNTVIGQGAMQYSYTGDYNVAVGTFVMEVQDGVSSNTGIGTYALRGNKMGSGNTSVGRESSYFSSTAVESLTITNGGSGYTTATITISAPETATPGTVSTQATATAIINSGAITGATITNMGSGYSSTKTPVTVTITGDGTGATATVVLKSAANNTTMGYLASRFNQAGSRQTIMGSEANYGTSANQRGVNDDDITLIGYRATRSTARSTTTPYKYSTAIGSNATFDCDSCFILGTTFTRAGSGTTNPDASAQFDVTSTTRGFLPPRMSAAQRTAIASPASGLIVFDLDSLSTFQYNGSAWQNLYNTGGGGGSGTVNSGTQYRLGYYATTGTAISEAAAITGDRALISDANGVPTHSATTATELGYVSGVTSAIQTQLDAKATGSITQNWFDDDLTLNGVTTKINRADFFDDMLTTPTSLAGTSYMLEFVSGTGADASIGSTGTNPDGSGWALMSSGTTTTGVASLGSTSVTQGKNKVDTTKTYRFETNVQIEALSDDTEDFRFVAGFISYTTNTTGSNGIWFRYNDNTNSGNWTCYSSDATTTQNTNSGVAAAAGTTVRLGFEYDNAQIRFYINGSLVATHTTNIPAHNGSMAFPVLAVTKTAGTTNRNIFIDYVKYRRL